MSTTINLTATKGKIKATGRTFLGYGRFRKFNSPASFCQFLKGAYTGPQTRVYIEALREDGLLVEDLDEQDQRAA